MIAINSITQGDCLDLIKEVPDDYIDSIITDPPYFIGVTHNGQKGVYSDLIIMKPFFDSLFFQFKRVLKKDGCIYMCCDYRTYPFMYQIIYEYITVRNLLVWDKHSGPGSFYSSAHEFIIFCSDRNRTFKGGLNVLSTIPAFNSGAKKTNGEKVHPTQKPVELFEKFILDSTKVGDVVLDAFAGSGTLALAAIRTNRNYICFESQDKYVNIAKKRIANLVGNFSTGIKNCNELPNLFNQKNEDINER